MDFDHVRGVKLANVSRLIAAPTHLLLAEIEKCELVCAACHRTRTSSRLEEDHVQAALDADEDAHIACLPFEDAPDA